DAWVTTAPTVSEQPDSSLSHFQVRLPTPVALSRAAGPCPGASRPGLVRGRRRCQHSCPEHRVPVPLEGAFDGGEGGPRREDVVHEEARRTVSEGASPSSRHSDAPCSIASPCPGARPSQVWRPVLPRE